MNTDAIVPSRGPSALRRRPGSLAARLSRRLAGGLLLLLGACGHRSTAEFSQQVPVVADKTAIRIEIENGTIGVAPSSDRSIAIAGGVRRAADTAALLAQLEAVPLTFRVIDDPRRPELLVLKGPELPPGATGILGLELGVRLPADMPLEIVIRGSGHVTLGDRRAASDTRTGRGDLRFERCAGGVFAKTGSGNVIAFDHKGDVDLQTNLGDMQVFVREPGPKVRLVTGQGTIQCYLPSATELEVDARVEVGRIGNSFGLVAETVASYGAALVGRLGSGATKVVLRSGSGHIALSKKDYP